MIKKYILIIMSLGLFNCSQNNVKRKVAYSKKYHCELSSHVTSNLEAYEIRKENVFQHTEDMEQRILDKYGEKKREIAKSQELEDFKQEIQSKLDNAENYDLPFYGQTYSKKTIKRWLSKISRVRDIKKLVKTVFKHSDQFVKEYIEKNCLN